MTQTARDLIIIEDFFSKYKNPDNEEFNFGDEFLAPHEKIEKAKELDIDVDIELPDEYDPDDYKFDKGLKPDGSLKMSTVQYKFVIKLANIYYFDLVSKNMDFLITKDDFIGEVLELWSKERRKNHRLPAPMFTNHFKLKSSNWLKDWKRNHQLPSPREGFKPDNPKQFIKDYKATDDIGDYLYTLDELGEKYGVMRKAIIKYAKTQGLGRKKYFTKREFIMGYNQKNEDGSYKYSVKDMARLMQISETAVYYRIERYGKRFDNCNDASVIRCFYNGEKVKDVAEKFNKSLEFIYRIHRKYKAEKEKWDNFFDNDVPISEISYEEVCEKVKGTDFEKMINEFQNYKKQQLNFN